MTSTRIIRLAPTLLLAACSSMPDVATSITPYRVDVRQGNFVSQEMVGQLRPGMTREQVRFILGTPLVADLFHADRWDYVYRFQPGRGELQQRRLAVFFEQGKLARVAGDVIGADAGETPAAGAPAAGRVIEIGPAGRARDGSADNAETAAGDVK